MEGFHAEPIVDALDCVREIDAVPTADLRGYLDARDKGVLREWWADRAAQAALERAPENIQ